jgi:hypothetical protein
MFIKMALTVKTPSRRAKNMFFDFGVLKANIVNQMLPTREVNAIP